MSLKKTNGVRLKKEKITQVLVHKFYTDDRKPRMIIVKDQWTAILANCVRKLVMSSNSKKDIYYSGNDSQRQEKLASLILYIKHMLKSITLNGIFNSKVVALYILY